MRCPGGELRRFEDWEDLAREAERVGNVHMANGLALKARAAYRVADAIRSVGADDKPTADDPSRGRNEA